MADWDVAKVYSDRNYLYTTTVRHSGTTIAFAIDDRRHIYYSVLELDREDVPAGSPDVAYWGADPLELRFPTEITTVGYAAAGNTTMPTVRLGGSAEVDPTRVQPQEIDPFLSSTARLTAGVPFQVVSDGTHVVLFRLSVQNGHNSNAYELTGGGTSGVYRTDYVLVNGAPAPVVDENLLCDRFVLVGGVLQPLGEVRYRRSRDRTQPASGTDSLGTNDMDGSPFVEPTQKLAFLGHASGAFTVLLLPTAVSDVRRWQFFVNNFATGRIDAYNVEQGADGLFNTLGSQLWTSPDPNYAKDVLERSPGIDQFTGQPLVPVVSMSDQGETTIWLQGYGYVDLGNPAPLQLQGAFTVEAWISLEAPGGVVLAKQNTAQGGGFSLGTDASGEPTLSFGTAQLTATGWSLTNLGPMTHVAAVFDGTTATLYVNGNQVASQTLAFTADTSTSVLLGARYEGTAPGSLFQGEIGEVRIWGRARTADEVREGRSYRLAGNEPDLLAYYRCDEGDGATVFDATDNCLNGTLQGSCRWNSRISWAQIPDPPGLTRRSFQFTGRTADTGLTATLYFQQERAVSGYGGPAKPAKVQARVLLACGTSASPAPGVPAIATLDFAVSRDGRLARVPNQVDLPLLGRPDPTQDLAAISAAQQAIANLQGSIVENQAIVAAAASIDRQIALLEQQLLIINLALAIDQQVAISPWMYAVMPSTADKATINAIIVSLQQQLAPLYAQRAAAQAAAGHVVADQVALTAQQQQLAALTGGLQGGDVTIPMPLVGTDTTGLAFYGGLLAFAWTPVTPYLLDSGTGDVVLYFRGADLQFFATYYDTDVVRSVKQLDAGGSPLRLVARDPAIALAGVSVTVSPGSAADKCNVMVSDGTNWEQFIDVPRQADQFAAVLNGAVDMWSSSWREAVYRPGQSLGSSHLVAVDARGLTSPVADGSATDVVAGQACRWHGDAPGRAFLFDGQTQCLALPAAQLAQASVPGDLTVEAWVNPDIAGPRGRVLDANANGAQYTLGLSGVQAMTALSFNGSTDFIDCGPTINLTNTDFTVELWVQRNTTGRFDFVLGHGSHGATDTGLHIGFRDSDVFTIDFLSDGLTTSATYTDGNWHHWAGVFEYATRTRILYCDGVEVARDTAGGAYSGAGDLTVGSRMPNSWFASVSLDEVRIWARARTADDIAVTMNRRLTGNEAGLLAYWSFPNAQTADLSGNGHDGRVNGSPALVASPIASYQVVAGVGPDFVCSRDVFPAHEWAHLAVAQEQSWAVHLDGSSYLDVDPADALNLGHEWTIEVFFQLDKLGVTHGLLSKGVIGGNDGGGVPYALRVGPAGELVLDMDWPPGTGAATILAGLQPGVFYRVGVTRQAAPLQLSTSPSSPPPTPQDNITAYVNGQSYGPFTVPTNWTPTNTSTLELGRSRSGATTSWLCGVLAEVRLWNVARNPANLGAPVAPGVHGLVARWHFPESAGNTTRDDSGSYPARLAGATWTKDPDPRGSRLSLYHNGVAATADPLDPADPLVAAGYGEPQFTLGGRTAAGALAEPFAGALDEVRVWQTARTPQEILDNLFTRLRTPGDDLVAYYPFDAASTVAGAPVRDGGPRGNYLAPPTPAQAPAIVLSTAPVSSDIPQIRSALTGVPTSFNALVDWPGGVGEYGTLERGSGGVVSGELKRCYSYVRSGRWHLVAGYKIGDLVADWLGQAQFDPQLYGYIEGAPPVPSENMTAGPIDPVVRKDLDASKVTFVQADEVTNSLSTSREGSFQFGAKLSIEAEFGGEVWTVTAPLGVGTAEPLAEVKGKLGGSVAFDMDIGWSSDVEVSQATNVARMTSVSLTGDWEDPNHILFPGAGRRYVPVNTGFALVQSETADVFALRLAHNSAVVAYRMLPNPDIPRDWNIIPFPINPRYTKQGTLDGAIGFDLNQARALDPDYPMAGQPGEYSYFKPSEAYALKRRIQQEQQRLQGLYDSASTYAVGGADPAAERAAKVLAGMSGGPVPDTAVTGDAGAAAQRAARRNLANTYVWTAEGGFFAETTETTDSVSETTGGSFSWKVETTIEGSVEFEAFDAVGMSIGLELSFGGGHTTTLTKTREAKQTFSVDVDCDLARSLQQFTLPDLQGVFDAAGNPVPAPGKVDAYRFMTFYLDSSRENFEDFYGKVVDPTWLAQSEEPNASALRQAQQSDRKPPCWRVLHRVTFVSRLLPDLGTPGAAPVEDAMKTLDISSSYDLISRLDPYVRPAATSIATLTTATNSALAAHLPALVPHAPQIISFLALYYGVER